MDRGIVDANCQIAHIWISITNHGDQPAALPDNPLRQAALFLAFDDVEAKCQPGDTPMTDAQAQQIVDFVEEWQDKVHLICVNCLAGICRSSGAAVALSLLLYGNDSGISGDSTYFPNRHVVSTIMKHGKTIAKVEPPSWWRQLWSEND